MSLFSGLSRPLKVAGLALIGVAFVAAMIGGVTALNSGNSNEAANPPPTASASPPTAPNRPSAPPQTSPSPSASSSLSPTSTTSPSPTSSVPGSAPTEGGKPGGDQQASAKWVTVRVYNNSTIRGLAARAADDFRDAGWNVVDVSNYSAGVIRVTTVYYRPGTDEETAAKAMAAEFRIRAEARFAGIQQSSPGVIVIVTNNYESAKDKSGS